MSFYIESVFFFSHFYNIIVNTIRFFGKLKSVCTNAGVRASPFFDTVSKEVPYLPLFVFHISIGRPVCYDNEVICIVLSVRAEAVH